MPLHLKAIVFRTRQLKEALAFYRGRLGCVIKESSLTHFVIHSQGVRILFVESNEAQAVEFYFTRNFAMDPTVQEDPNDIKIIVL